MSISKHEFPLGSKGWLEDIGKRTKDLEDRLAQSSAELSVYKSVIAGDLSGVINRLSTLEVPDYKLYEGSATQTGTAAPEVSVFKNSLSTDSIVWTRTGVGTYHGVLTGAFPDGRTILELGQTGSGSKFTRVDDDTVEIITYGNTLGTAADALLNNTSIKITVYNESL